MALWLLRAIVFENVSVRPEDKTLYFPADPNIQLAGEIKNVLPFLPKPIITDKSRQLGKANCRQ